ncbi:stage II sporulation protein D [Bacillus sp. B15-48]|uniref:stage II sporulation protein D n=1 Tax=Bacillus sp. B15-48 TaxID=1548601 RepID=UPI00193ED036|nr:stage II sporulation protein D [Bacillus sp. B15-48]MBM4761513.1 stage II sporulation protein D [Bacillus sp. B15-48]
MKKFNPILVITATLFTVILLIPTLLVLPFMGEKASGKLNEEPFLPMAAEPLADSAVEVAVFRTAQSQLEKVPLDEYLYGVVSAEMPAEFELEALKAQALTARTYYLRHILTNETSTLPEGAEVTDTEAHQVYKNRDELKRQWGADYDWKMSKVIEAVRATDGQILTYEGNPITATFFSTSNGYTENSEDYWSNKYPYLRSVESPWDKASPKFTEQTIMPISDFERRLGVQLSDRTNIGTILERTPGNRVGKVEIAGKVLSGKDVRERLGLNSSDFKWQVKGDNVIIETTGYGHGVGMSQYGANGMAAEGKTYEDIVKHYYKGVEITSSEPTLAQVAQR